MMDKKDKKKRDNALKVKLLLIAAITVFVTKTVTYGFFVPTKSQTGENTMTSGCFEITFTGESNSINLTNAYPVSNSKGQQMEPYKFTIKNTCDTTAAYRVILSSKVGSFSDTHINTSVGGGDVKTLATITPNTTYEIDEGYASSYILTSGTLIKNDTATVEVRAWINAMTTYEDVVGKDWQGQIKVVSTVAALER